MYQVKYYDNYEWNCWFYLNKNNAKNKVIKLIEDLVDRQGYDSINAWDEDYNTAEEIANDLFDYQMWGDWIVFEEILFEDKIS